MPCWHGFIQAWELRSSLQCMSARHFPVQWGVYGVSAGDFLEHKSCRMLDMPGRDVFRAQCHDVH